MPHSGYQTTTPAIGNAGDFQYPGTDEAPIQCNFNNVLARAGLPTISDTTLEWMLKPTCNTPQELATAKATWIENSNKMVPESGIIPVLGRKPDDGGEPALKLLPIPNDTHSIRLFPGGIERNRQMLFFDFVQEGKAVPMPQGYSVHQLMLWGNVPLQGMHHVLGFQLPSNGESFAILEEASVVLIRPDLTVSESYQHVLFNILSATRVKKTTHSVKKSPDVWDSGKCVRTWWSGEGSIRQPVFWSEDAGRETLINLLMDHPPLWYTPREYTGKTRHLSSEALLSISMLCQRLHHLALPIFFAAHGMEDPTQNANVTMLYRGRDGVSALQMALFIPSITKLSCSLPHYETVHPLVPHIRRLRVLVARLAFIREMTLVLDTQGSSCGADGDGVEQWALEFGELLNTILKRGCTTLTLRYGRFFYEGCQLRPNPLVNRPVSAFRNAVRQLLPANLSTGPSDACEVWQTDAGMVSMELDDEGRSASTLTHFKIESTALFVPPCFSWFLAVLRHSPITTLEIHGVTLLQKIWAAVLPPVAALVSTLTSLTLSNLYGISGIDILLFLGKLPRLKFLTIGYTEYSRRIQSSYPDSAPIPKLPELTHLHAPSTFIYHLLQKKSSLPSIKAVCITPRRPIMAIGPRGVCHIGRFVSDIVRRLEKYALAPELTLEIHRGRRSDAEMTADLALVPKEELIKSLRAITRLIVYSESSDMTARELETLARWIARFPALLHVSLRVRGAAAAREDAWASFDNARMIYEQNPNVRSFELNGKLFEAGNINAGAVLPRETPPSIIGV
ncbi:hypothetical protein B0H12DRAFT_1221759 [Mycena haematopus]|nr:hypothetical protein B0H12DRAFT_1221759 [Mycena haematopus]